MAMKTCLYSITYLGVWYTGGALTWKEVLGRAKKFGYDGVEFDAKRPHANPMDWDDEVRKAVVYEAGNLGLTLPALSANNNFASPLNEQREAELLMVKEQLKLARDLGCKLLRVFAAWSGITFKEHGVASYDEARRNWYASFPDVTKLQRWRFVRDCLKEMCKYAEEYGVYLALQNHSPIINTWRDLYNMVREVDSPWLKVCFDLNPECDNPEEITKAFNTFGDLDIHYHFNGEWTRDASGKVVLKDDVYIGWQHYNLKNYPHFINEMNRIGYDGYLSYEFCHPALINSEPADVRYVDEQTQFALEYIKGLAGIK